MNKKRYVVKQFYLWSSCGVSYLRFAHLLQTIWVSKILCSLIKVVVSQLSILVSFEKMNEKCSNSSERLVNDD